DHALVPVLACDDVRAAALVRLGPRFELRGGLAEDASLDGLALAVQLLELVRETARLVGVVGQEQVECSARMAEASGGVDARAETEAARARVDGCGIDACGAHQRLQARFLRACERAQPRDRESAVLVAHGSGDRGGWGSVDV